MPVRRLTLISALATAVLSVTAGSATAQLRLQEVGEFDGPAYVAGAPGDYRRIYVVELDGRIQVVRNGAKLSTPFVDLSASVLTGGEQGLLSVAFAPDFQSSRLLYVYFTNNAGNNEVVELRAASGDRADPQGRRVIELPHPVNTNHNGGQLQFGRDGYLYIAPGDGGGGGDPDDNAQNLGSLLGKILRIDPRGGSPYHVPPDNPFVGQAGRRPEIWAFGLRNPYRFSFDRATGDLTVGDVGEQTTEEIDYVPAGAGAGRSANFGWDLCEGSFATGSKTEPCPTTSVKPVIDRFQDDGWRAIIGGYVVRDPSLPSLRGRYVYGDNSQERLYSAQLRTPRAADDRPLGLSVSALSSFGEDTAGCVYATSLSGTVYRLVERSTQVPCRDFTSPRLRVRAPRRQRVRKRRGAIAYARCSERCTVRMAGRLRIGGRSYRLKRARKTTRANRRIRLRVRLTRRASRALRQALSEGRRARVRLAIRALDGAGNRTRFARRTVRVRR